MTRREFIKRVEEMGFTVELNKLLKVMFISSKCETIAKIGDSHEFKIDTLYQGGDSPMTEKLLDLIIEYVKTPAEDREEPKKYYLKAPGAIRGLNFLNRTPHMLNKFGYTPPTLNFGAKLSGYPVQNQFTEKEIAELPAWCQALERIEVE